MAAAAIAAHYFGVHFVGGEIDADYYDAAKARLDAETRHMVLLAPNSQRAAGRIGEHCQTRGGRGAAIARGAQRVDQLQPPVAEFLGYPPVAEFLAQWGVAKFLPKPTVMEFLTSLQHQHPALDHSDNRRDECILPKLAALLPRHLGPLI